MLTSAELAVGQRYKNAEGIEAHIDALAEGRVHLTLRNRVLGVKRGNWPVYQFLFWVRRARLIGDKDGKKESTEA